MPAARASSINSQANSGLVRNAGSALPLGRRLAGRYARTPSGTWRVPSAQWLVTETTPLAVKFSLPIHCWAASTMPCPRLRSPVSSTISAPPAWGPSLGWARHSASRRRLSSTASHAASCRKWCNRWRSAPGTRAARTVSVLLCSRGNSSPIRYCRKASRVGHRLNRSSTWAQNWSMASTVGRAGLRGVTMRHLRHSQITPAYRSTRLTGSDQPATKTSAAAGQSRLDADQQLAVLARDRDQRPLLRAPVLEIDLGLAHAQVTQPDLPQPVREVRRPDAEPAVEAAPGQPQHRRPHVRHRAGPPGLRIAGHRVLDGLAREAPVVRCRTGRRPTGCGCPSR